MIQFENRDNQLDNILARMAESIQLDETRRLKMITSYEAIENLLNADDFFEKIDFEIYPQGSVKIGTTVRPSGRNEFDLDIVVHLIVDWNEYTPEKIYNELKRVLKNSGHHEHMVELKNRCIRLNYSGDFHMDILPGVQENSYDNTLLKVPDRNLGDWVSSNPKGYAEWFLKRNNSITSWILEKAYAKEDLPADDFVSKKPLQRSVQLLKKYRDEYFTGNEANATSSIILTTIAGQLYDGEDSIFKSIDNIVTKIKNDIAISSLHGEKKIQVLNPVNSSEDFTDKWEDEPNLFEHFKKFINHLGEEWDKLKREIGVIDEGQILKGLFSETTFIGGQETQTEYVEKMRRERKLGVNRSTGILSSILPSKEGLSQVNENTFFGTND